MAAVSLGTYALIAAVTVAGAGTYAAIDNADHAKTDANNAANVASDRANAQITAANQQQTNRQNQQANATATAQARVRAINNPDGDSIMTTPLGEVGPKGPPVPGAQVPGGPTTANLNGPQASPGMVTGPGKTTIGG